MKRLLLTLTLAASLFAANANAGIVSAAVHGAGVVALTRTETQPNVVAEVQ